MPCNEGYFLRVNDKSAAALQFRDWMLDQLAAP
jgi:hypothetical protein